VSTYKIVQKINGKFVITNPANIYAWCDANDRKYEPLSLRRRSALRAELKDQPKIEGLLGPMYDGDQDNIAVVRYEDEATYREMSE
jgi:hypothetical protein